MYEYKDLTLWNVLMQDLIAIAHYVLVWALVWNALLVLILAQIISLKKLHGTY